MLPLISTHSGTSQQRVQHRTKTKKEAHIIKTKIIIFLECHFQEKNELKVVYSFHIKIASYEYSIKKCTATNNYDDDINTIQDA